MNFALRLMCAALVAGIAGCAGIQTPPARFCAAEGLLVDSNFEGGNFAQCSVNESGRVEMVIRPEDEPPINQSPWYAFRVSTGERRAVDISIRFEDGYARYWPKTSTDQNRWILVPEADVERSQDGLTMNIRLQHEGGTLYVAGQALLSTEFYEQWLGDLLAHDDMQVVLAGHSTQGRPMFGAQSHPRKEVVFLLGRQHPPEMTGALAMRSFVDTVLADTELAQAFRERFSIVVVPLINPDGVALGHWRHNVNGIDLNRDWGPFTQTETQNVRRFLEASLADGAQLRLMLDFHSTRINTFYTQLPEESGYSFDFAGVWLDRSRDRLPDFEFEHDARAKSGQANTKNYFYDVYGVPAITYELGDETEKSAIDYSTPVFADEMMRTLLEINRNVQLSGR